MKSGVSKEAERIKRYGVKDNAMVCFIVDLLDDWVRLRHFASISVKISYTC